MANTVGGDYYPDEPSSQSLPYTQGQPSLPAVPEQSLPTPTAAGKQTDYSGLFQPGYLGTPATVAPTLAQPGQLDITQLLSQWMNPTGPQAAQSNATTGLSSSLTDSLGAGATIDQLLKGFAPQAQRANNNLTQMLANFGVGGGQAVGAEQQLQGQLASSIAPAIAAAIQNSQGNQLQAGEFSAGQGLQQALANAGFQQGANLQGSQQSATSNLNQNQALLQAMGINTGNIQQGNQFNASAANTAAGYNADQLNKTNAANVGQFNQSQQEQINALLNEYYAKLGAFQNINTGGQGAANQQAVQYGGEVTTTPDPFMQIFQGAAAAAPAFAKAGA